MKLSKILSRAGACEGAVEWSRAYDEDLAKAWSECDRGDWMVWIAARLGLDRKRLVLATCAVAERPLEKYWKHEDRRPSRCLEVARAWCRGEATLQEVREAVAACHEASREAWKRYVASAAAAASAAYASAAAAASAAYVASAADASAASAADAAYASAAAAAAAAASAAYVASAADASAASAADAAYASAADAAASDATDAADAADDADDADDAYAAARQDSLKESANLVRELISADELIALVKEAA